MPSVQQRLADLEAASEDLQAGLYRNSLGLGAISTKNLRPRSVVASTIDVSNLQSVSQKTGTLTVTGSVSAGQTAYDTGSGFFFGSAGNFSVGNSSGNKITWDGATLTITGSLSVGSTLGGWTINSTTITSNPAGATLDSAGVLTLGTSNDVVKLSAADATYRLWVGNATAASAPFRVDKTGAVTMTSGTVSGTLITSGLAFSSITGGGTMGSSTSLGANDITVNSTGKIKFGGGGADYLGNNILHFEVGSTEEATVEWKNASNTPHSRISGSAGAAVAELKSYADYDGTKKAYTYLFVDATGPQATIQSTYSSSHDAMFLTAATSAASRAAVYVGSATKAAEWDETNLRLKLAGYLYPGSGSAEQTSRYISDNGSAIVVNGPLTVIPASGGGTGGFENIGSVAVLAAAWTSTGASGALPSPTKFMRVNNGIGGTAGYIPIFSNFNPWTA